MSTRIAVARPDSNATPEQIAEIQRRWDAIEARKSITTRTPMWDDSDADDSEATAP